ncbi:putative domain HDIG-containing protein [Desulfosporosinus acidiphilus SJ4]|uniref:Putative domain HDIG-containing protein n=1 Tax=Desulfosporosinus acidiphilus (strain DSM 22704 / JCM 16185 / SJ4) TaxID=646529 RepID=I4DC11_DESAJ|nr:HD-GYP domain-containing protein [Desulfosporosinus acidiphilus]AFM43335.1 putative domain HDIG-containing protein [Desulfosporosinus acidiphilus SJ4]
MSTLPVKFRWLLILLTAAAAVTFTFSVVHTEWTSAAVTHLLIFGMLAVLCESFPVALPRGGYVTVSFAVFYTALILYPGGVAVAVSAIGGLFLFGKAAKYQPLFKRVYNSSQYLLSQAVAQYVLWHAGIGGGFHYKFRSFILYVVVALIYIIVNISLVTIGLGLLQERSPWSIWLSNMRWIFPNIIILAPVGYIMALIYYHYGPLGLLLVLVPLLLSHRFFQLYITMRKNHLETVGALVQALEAKDIYTGGHSERVGKLAVSIAEAIKMTEDKIEFLKYAALLHDVGKIGISDVILNKEGELLESEWDVIRSHPVIGQTIIENIKFMFDIGKVIRHHHERYDGKGYPDGIRGEAVPLEARIIAVADTYDAMTSDRSYRPGKSHDEAIEELKRVSGSQLDPKMVEIFCELIEHKNNDLTGKKQIETTLAAKKAVG